MRKHRFVCALRLRKFPWWVSSACLTLVTEYLVEFIASFFSLAHLGSPVARFIEVEAVLPDLPERLQVVVSVHLRVLGPLAERAADVQPL